MSPNKTGDPAVLEEDGFLYTVTNGQAEIIGLPMGFTDLAELPSVIGGRTRIMIAEDTNLLVYAHREDSPWHDAALKVMMGLADLFTRKPAAKSKKIPLAPTRSLLVN